MEECFFFGRDFLKLNYILTGILTDLSRDRRNDPEWEKNPDVRLNPDGIAEVAFALFSCSAE